MQNLSDTEDGEEVIEDDDDPSALSEEQLHYKERKLLLSEVEIPPLLGPEQPFSATIIQEHALLDTERYAAGVRPSGLSERVDNIVRGFQVRGLLNRNTLSRALDAVARLHPMLTVQFYRKNNKLYIQCNPGTMMHPVYLWIYTIAPDAQFSDKCALLQGPLEMPSYVHTKQ